MSILQTIVIGIVTGILTTVLLFIFKELFTKVVIPWYQELIYKGVDISGTWIYVSENDDYKCRFNLTIQQKAHNIRGFLYATQLNDNKNSKCHFVINGKLWEGYLSLNLEAVDRKSLSFATSLFKVSAGGKQLIGDLSYRNIFEDKVVSEELDFKREVNDNI